MESKQQRAALAEAIESLSERQQNVLQLYYRCEFSMKQIAALMGVHESRVSQIHLAAITRLRKTLLGTRPLRQAPERSASTRNRQEMAMAV